MWIIRVTPKFVRYVTAAGLALVGLMLVNIVVGLFNDTGIGIRENGPIGIVDASRDPAPCGLGVSHRLPDIPVHSSIRSGSTIMAKTSAAGRPIVMVDS